MRLTPDERTVGPRRITVDLSPAAANELSRIEQSLSLTTSDIFSEALTMFQRHYKWHPLRDATPNIGWHCIVKDSHGREEPASLDEQEKWVHDKIGKRLQFLPTEWRYATSEEIKECD